MAKWRCSVCGYIHEDFMLTLNVAVVNLVWEKFEKKNERKNK